MKATEENILRGGQFLVKETNCDDIFIPEDFTEEQKMMKEAVTEFVDREIWPNKPKFEAKDYALTESCMKKAAEMGFLGVSVPEEYYISYCGDKLSAARIYLYENGRFRPVPKID